MKVGSKYNILLTLPKDLSEGLEKVVQTQEYTTKQGVLRKALDRYLKEVLQNE